MAVKNIFCKHKVTSETNPEMRTELYNVAKSVLPKTWRYVESYVNGRVIYDVLNHKNKCLIHSRRHGVMVAFVEGLRLGIEQGKNPDA